jgi:hypothetical protein
MGGANVADAVRKSFEDLPDGGAALEEAWEKAFEEESPDQGSTETPSVPEGGTGDVDSGDSGAGEASEPEEAEDLPESYFGFDLSPYEPEERKAILAAFKERDREIQQAKREAAEAREAAAEAAEPEFSPFDPSVISDEQIAEALGFDPDDPYFEVKAQATIPLAREILDLRNEVQSLAQNYTGDKTSAMWATEVRKLEQVYGELPPGMGVEDVVGVADEFGISDPEAAFLKATAQRRLAFAETVADTLGTAKVDVMARKRSAPKAVKPRGQNSVDKPEDLRGLPLREALQKGLENSEKRLGLDIGKAAEIAAAGISR